MSASLVGSEMCIRDSNEGIVAITLAGVQQAHPAGRRAPQLGQLREVQRRMQPQQQHGVSCHISFDRRQSPQLQPQSEHQQLQRQHH
eukprot:5585572-Alexandrium_andersonii.AAC.1